MKGLETFVNEKLKVGTGIKKTEYHPNSKEELVNLIINEIKTNGPTCSLNHIDVSNIKDMSYLLRGGNKDEFTMGHPILSEFNGDISDWDVSNVTDMKYMFELCRYSGKNGDIFDWDVSKVTNMKGMFKFSNYNGDISRWDVSTVTNMSHMFMGSKYTGKDGGISGWDVSNVTNMTSMFAHSKFNGDLSNWDVSNVTSMMDMFNDCSYSGKYGGISDWDVSNVTNMQGMFNNNCNFNGDLSKWNVAKVVWFIWMFRNSTFSGDISTWNINPRAKGHMDGMFINSPLQNTPPRWYYKYR